MEGEKKTLRFSHLFLHCSEINSTCEDGCAFTGLWLAVKRLTPCDAGALKAGVVSLINCCYSSYVVEEMFGERSVKDMRSTCESDNGQGTRLSKTTDIRWDKMCSWYIRLFWSCD